MSNIPVGWETESAERRAVVWAGVLVGVLAFLFPPSESGYPRFVQRSFLLTLREGFAQVYINRLCQELAVIGLATVAAMVLTTPRASDRGQSKIEQFTRRKTALAVCFGVVLHVPFTWTPVILWAVSTMLRGGIGDAVEGVGYVLPLPLSLLLVILLLLLYCGGLYGVLSLLAAVASRGKGRRTRRCS